MNSSAQRAAVDYLQNPRRRSRQSSLPLLLLAVCAARFYLWDAAPPGQKGYASSALGGLLTAFLLLLVVYLRPTTPVFLVAAWFSFESLQTTVCHGWYLVDPWPVDPDIAMCSQKAGLDIGALTITAVALLALRLYTWSRDG